jgi:hypothetical protein
LRSSKGDQQQQQAGPNCVAGQHPRATAGTLSSAQSTISLSTHADQPQQTVRSGSTAAAVAKGVSASSAGARQQDPMVSEVRPHNSCAGGCLLAAPNKPCKSAPSSCAAAAALHGNLSHTGGIYAANQVPSRQAAWADHRQGPVVQTRQTLSSHPAC